jgi:HK97 gp10 family phage protein
MRVNSWNPQKYDGEIIAASMDRLEQAAQVVAEDARRRVPIGKSRTGTRGGKDWTAREAGALKASIRVVRLHGDPKRNVRIYAGNRQVFYARFVEYGTAKMKARPFLRPALNASKGRIQDILRSGG